MATFKKIDTPIDDPDLQIVPIQLTAEQVGQMLGYHPATVRRMAARGEIEMIHKHRAVRYTTASVRAWRQRNIERES